MFGMYEENDHGFSSRTEAVNELEKFLSLESDIQVGDYIELNDWGKGAICASIGGETAVKVLKKLDKPRITKEGDIKDIFVAVCVHKNTVVHRWADSRYFQKVNAKKTNRILNFKGKNNE